MKILEWNVNQRANHINTVDLPPFIADALKREDPDFFVLTECYKVKHIQEFISAMEGYTIYISDNSCHHQNEVVIGVRDGFVGSKLSGTMESGVENKNPNFLHVTIEVDGEGRILHLIGVRIRVPKGCPSSAESQNYRLEQLDSILDYVEKLEEPVVLVGDFNNYRRGLSPATMGMPQADITKCSLWNMSVLEERFHEYGFEMHTPDGFSWGWANPNVKYQFAQDHAFLRGVSLAKNDFDGSDYCYYVDDFMTLAPEIYEDHGIKHINPPHPDHKMLVLEIDMF